MPTLKSFAEYAEAARREPFEFPMPDGQEPVVIAQPTVGAEQRAQAAVKAADGDAYEQLYAGLRVYVGDGECQRIEEAYAGLPGAVLAAVFEDMRQHFTGPRDQR